MYGGAETVHQLSIQEFITYPTNFDIPIQSPQPSASEAMQEDILAQMI